mmetsp:Transcript_13316/g.29366  ORF Transcript_13316/g.29366 Transcript_13316/m.29366 type:complete len:265 (-) Transcript_13316:416-1210(-)
MSRTWTTMEMLRSASRYGKRMRWGDLRCGSRRPIVTTKMKKRNRTKPTAPNRKAKKRKEKAKRTSPLLPTVSKSKCRTAANQKKITNGLPFRKTRNPKRKTRKETPPPPLNPSRRPPRRRAEASLPPQPQETIVPPPPRERQPQTRQRLTPSLPLRMTMIPSSGTVFPARRLSRQIPMWRDWQILRRGAHLFLLGLGKVLSTWILIFQMSCLVKRTSQMLQMLMSGWSSMPSEMAWKIRRLSLTWVLILKKICSCKRLRARQQW